MDIFDIITKQNELDIETYNYLVRLEHISYIFLI